MNQIDQQDPCELLRTAGFTEAEIEYLGRLRRAYSEKSSWLTPAEERRLAFVRWLVTTGRLTEQVAWSVLEEHDAGGRRSNQWLCKKREGSVIDTLDGISHEQRAAMFSRNALRFLGRKEVLI